MTMKYEWWKEILSAVNEKEDLSNVIEEINKRLEAEDKDEYEK